MAALVAPARQLQGGNILGGANQRIKICELEAHEEYYKKKKRKNESYNKINSEYGKLLGVDKGKSKKKSRSMA